MRNMKPKKFSSACFVLVFVLFSWWMVWSGWWKGSESESEVKCQTWNNWGSFRLKVAKASKAAVAAVALLLVPLLRVQYRYIVMVPYQCYILHARYLLLSKSKYHGVLVLCRWYCTIRYNTIRLICYFDLMLHVNHWTSNSNGNLASNSIWGSTKLTRYEYIVHCKLYIELELPCYPVPGTPTKSSSVGTWLTSFLTHS